MYNFIRKNVSDINTNDPLVVKTIEDGKVVDDEPFFLSSTLIEEFNNLPSKAHQEVFIFELFRNNFYLFDELEGRTKRVRYVVDTNTNMIFSPSFGLNILHQFNITNQKVIWGKFVEC